jgi:hypothetical protein
MSKKINPVSCKVYVVTKYFEVTSADTLVLAVFDTMQHATGYVKHQEKKEHEQEGDGIFEITECSRFSYGE